MTLIQAVAHTLDQTTTRNENARMAGEDSGPQAMQEFSGEAST